MGGDLSVLLMARIITQITSLIAFPMWAPSSFLCIVNLLAIEVVKTKYVYR